MNLIEKTKAYRASPSLNQSKLNWIRQGFKKEKNSEVFNLGNIMEAKMCYPELFDEMFIIGKVPGGRGAEIIRELVDDGVDLDHMTDEQIKFYCTDYYEEKSIDTRHNALLKLHQYYDDLKEVSGKTLVNKKQVDIVDRKLSKIDYRFITEGATFQEWIEFEFMGEQCKALIDVVNDKWYDIKSTTKSLLDFPSSIENYGYDIQAYWYYLAMFTKYPEIEFGGYYVVPLFTEEPARLFTWNLFYGRDKTLNLVERFKWHRDNNIWYSHLLEPEVIELQDNGFKLTF